ncbi:hypothetical protein CXG81DRAFT_11443 [Caulochytrium protostelioides]|uniref:Cytochrome b5 heme-binding domain-containing protein n=1 Tax=Caulochytrium protostelioides TaxID=1555241 RepID=A0A4P9XA24_9FUNG|nr:hypothetical protein CXG81DRAFT_11443 [Caulochytrium protostelioides]|eukprot:RKP01891.1 hypothetical protein CXG81DRAFT_11443 [Caulochytrium protostelioides]
MTGPQSSQGAAAQRIISLAEVKQHNTADSNWIIIDDTVYDVSEFADMHPGGAGILQDVAGTDATEQFYALHRIEVLTKYKPRLAVGRVEGVTAKVKLPEPGALSTGVPYAETPFDMGYKSPYLNESHRAFRIAVRTFCDTHLAPVAQQADLAGEPVSDALYGQMGRCGLLAARLGPGPHLQFWPDGILGVVKPQQFDYFHEAIVHEELSRIGAAGWVDSLGTGFTIGAKQVLLFGQPALRDGVGAELLKGEKRIALAVTEPTHGSDVAGIRTTARLSDCKQFWIVNGIKKWITNGHQSAYFTTAVRTNDRPGMGGISMLLVPRGPGLTTRPIKTSYSAAAGTALVIMENVKVPVGNLLGKEGKGFMIIMAGFNAERAFICSGMIGAMRRVNEECFKWACQRKIKGVALIQSDAIQLKLASMISAVEAVAAWHEALLYQRGAMSFVEQNMKLGGPIALLKYQITRVAEHISDEACQIFGGRSLTQTGMGRGAEQLRRSVKFAAILGGSEEIMAQLGVRQALRDFDGSKL